MAACQTPLRGCCRRVSTSAPPWARQHSLDTTLAGLLMASPSWARSSAGEHSLHTGGVTGSIPVAPTIKVEHLSHGLSHAAVNRKPLGGWRLCDPRNRNAPVRLRLPLRARKRRQMEWREGSHLVAEVVNTRALGEKRQQPTRPHCHKPDIARLGSKRVAIFSAT